MNIHISYDNESVEYNIPECHYVRTWDIFTGVIFDISDLDVIEHFTNQLNFLVGKTCTITCDNKVQFILTVNQVHGSKQYVSINSNTIGGVQWSVISI